MQPDPTTPARWTPEAEHLLRRAIATGLIKSGALDITEECDPLEWHACEACADPQGYCACSGEPHLSAEVWEAADRFGDLTKLAGLLVTPEAAAVIEAAREWTDYWRDMTDNPVSGRRTDALIAVVDALEATDAR